MSAVPVAQRCPEHPEAAACAHLHMNAPAALSPETVEVGMGVTWSVGSDRYAATVTKVSKSGKTIEFTDDKAVAKPGHGMFDSSQEYEYESVESYRTEEFPGFPQTNVKVARWNAKRGCFTYYKRLVFAGRHAYRDPSF